MVDQIGEVRNESELDDQEGVDIDLESLISKFILPIEKYRSKSAPNVFSGIFLDVIGNDLSASKNPNMSKESRAHAFYRMLGLPTIEPGGKFFNTGFNPLSITPNDRATREDINKNIPQAVKYAIATREGNARLRFERFYTANLESSAYSLALAVPRGQRLFMTMDKNIDSLNNIDLQSIKIPERSKFIKSNYKKVDKTDIQYTYDNVDHILRPFITDPVLSSQLDPTSGESNVLVAVPFLEKNDLEYEPNKYIKRPGIELILRIRLRQQNLLGISSYASTVVNYSLGTDISTGSQREIASAISNIGTDSVDVDRVLNELLYTEVYILNDFVKTLKGLIKLYVQSIETIENVSKKLIWTPLSRENGPEGGTEIKRGLIIPSCLPYLKEDWEIDRRILLLNIKSTFAKIQADIGTDVSYGDFTIPYSQNLLKLFDDQIRDEENKRTNLETTASNALRTIEYISGEVSGLGIIDILSIYMAMWSVDVSVLLNLIDDEAAKRLYNIKELRTKAVIDRYESIGDALTAYKEFEDRIMSILSYADKLYIRELGSPDEQEGGDITRSVGSIY